jgi:hypothetical protein
MATDKVRALLPLIYSIALAAGLSGCFIGAQLPSRDWDTDKLHQQADAALARWADAAAATGPQQAFVPVGEMTGQVGDWEVSTGDNNKSALMAGMVQAAANLSGEAPPDGEVRWQDGTTETMPLISAQDALSAMRTDRGGACPECTPLQITGARLTTGPAETSRGPATVPVWEFTVRGTAVRVTRVAIAAPISVEPPPWDPNDAPVGISIESATGTVGGRQLTVTFTGAPPGDQGCGADYTVEAVESPTAVVVIVTEHSHSGLFAACSAIGASRTAVVELAEPIGERAVLEVKEGLPVPVVLTQ